MARQVGSVAYQGQAGPLCLTHRETAVAGEAVEQGPAILWIGAQCDDDSADGHGSFAFLQGLSQPGRGVGYAPVGMTQLRPPALFLCVSLAGCGGAAGADPGGGEEERSASREPAMPAEAPRVHGVRIHQPDSLTSIATSETNARGETAGIPCASCHEMREEPYELPESADALSGPHEGLQFAHGDNACASCHHPERYDRLRLASGEAVPLTAAMRLCAQCHGTQKRDYDHGAHGGMRGYWDLSSGPRERNHCVDCHDPHTPAFPSYQPVFPPRDRFLGNGGDHE